MNICIFPGTFNPIHEAHIQAAEFALEKYNFDKIIFIPAYIPPHKTIDKDLASHRFNMVKLAISDNPKFDISDIEYKDEGKSYSLITVKKIKEMYNIQGRVNFIIGTDAFEKIKTWYKTDELSKITHFIVFPREVKIKKEDFVEYDFELADMEYLDISSTKIRQNKENFVNHTDCTMNMIINCLNFQVRRIPKLRLSI